jgi:hypothetical protein
MRHMVYVLVCLAYPFNNARLSRRSWTEAGLATVAPLLEQTEDVTIAIAPRRWSAWDIWSTFVSAVQEAGIPLAAAVRELVTAFKGCIGAPPRNASPASKLET